MEIIIQWNLSITATLGERHNGHYMRVAFVEGFLGFGPEDYVKKLKTILYGANQNYAKLLENQLAVIEHRLEGTVGEETEDLRQTRDEIKKKLHLVHDAMNKPLSASHKRTGTKGNPDIDGDEECTCSKRRKVF